MSRTPAPYDPKTPGCLRPPIRIQGVAAASSHDLIVIPGGFKKGLPPMGLQSIAFMSQSPSAGGFLTVSRRVQLSWVPQDDDAPVVDTTLERFFIFAPALTLSFTLFFAKPWVVPLDTSGNKPMKIRAVIGAAGAVDAIFQVTAQMVRVLDAEAAVAMKGGR